MTNTVRPYANAVATYTLAGWPCVLPVPAATKSPPPVGFTGAEGRDTDPLQLVAWAGTHAEHSIALRMPDDVVGIDVDHYDKGGIAKRGGDTLVALELRLGPLPATWRSSARDLPSGIRFYRLPAARYRTKFVDIEVIQRHHRYAVVWPSPHGETGGTYRWYDPAGIEVTDGAVPKPVELPELSAAWVAALAEGATDTGPAAAEPGVGYRMLGALQSDHGQPCAEMHSALLAALDLLARADEGSRHDTATGRVHHLVQLGAAGHPGAGWALLEVQQRWEQLTAGEDRLAEWERMLHTSARKAVTAVGRPAPVDRDPCLLSHGLEVPAPAPVDDRPETDGPADPIDLEPIEPPRIWHVREVIGAHAFDPNAGLDQPLAQAVLERMYPVLRYAYDAGGWLMRGPDRWDTREDLAEWAVAELADLMPTGNPEAEKGSDERDRADRRKRFMTSAGAGAIAKKSRALVAGGTHPCSLRTTDLDAEPDVLWAGGWAWDLRASTAELTPAAIDPATPHLHSAALTPHARPTPRWDAFTAAVWPEAALRAWALRVLAVAFTGYADRALPILLGETGRGKTQVVTLLMSVLGTYAHAADPRLLGGVDNAHASIVYALKGRRLSFIDEGPREGRWAQERLKQLTGGGELTANQMHRNPITFRPTHTLVMAANDEPILTDPAVRARARLIPCDGDAELVRRTRAAIGPLHGRAWRAEAPGVLAAMIGQAAAWLADPTSALSAAAPAGIAELVETIGVEQDPIRTWLEEETEPHEPGTAARQLYQAFVQSCRSSGVRADQTPTETKWGRVLTTLGYPSDNTKAGKIRRLRIRQGGGWMPLMPTNGPAVIPTQPANPPLSTNVDNASGGGLVATGGGLVAGSKTNPHPVNAQVSPPVSGDGGGLAGLSTPFAHTRAYTHAHDARVHAPAHAHTQVTPDQPANPPPEASDTPSDLHEQGGAGCPANPPPTRTQPATSTEKRDKSGSVTRAAAKLAEREAKYAAAAGPPVLLPARVDRAGTVEAITLEHAVRIVAGQAAAWGELTVDVETSGYPVGHEAFALRTVQLGGVAEAVVFDAADPAHQAAVRTQLAAAPVLVAHSATADLVPLAAAGLLDAEDAWARMHDTVIPAKLADPASTGSDPGLKQLSGAMLGPHATAPAADEARSALFKAGRWLTDTQATTPRERSGWAQVAHTCTTMVRYDGSDVLDTAALSQVLPPVPPALATRERAVERLTARVAHQGLRIDGEHVDRLLADHTAARDAAAARVRAHGIDNPGSDRQVAGALAERGVPLPRTAATARFPDGQPSVAAAVLESLRGFEGPAGDLVAAVLEHRHHDTAVGTFLEPYQQLVRHGDGRARPTVYTLGADTGRMSCVRPNLQQVPREGGFRACITADPGQLLISADFAGVEVRVMAALSQDRNLVAMLAEGVDLHSVIAAQVFGPEYTKRDRYTVKRGVFGWAYGGGVATLAKQVGCSESVMASVVDVLAGVAPEYVNWTEQVKTGVRRGSTAFPTYAGRVVHLDRRFPHKAPNYLVQGTARELLVDALLRWAGTRWGGAVILPVHDEILAAVPAAEAEDATTALVAAMQTELYGVAIAAEASAPAFAWADAA